MTPEAPSRNPQTEAGRGQHKTAHNGSCPADYAEECWRLQDIVAIEAEAAQRVVERIRKGLIELWDSPTAFDDMLDFLDEVAGAIGDSAGEEEGQP